MNIVGFEQVVVVVFEDTTVIVVAKKLPIMTYRKAVLLL